MCHTGYVRICVLCSTLSMTIKRMVSMKMTVTQDKRPKADRKPVHGKKEGWDGITADDISPLCIITNKDLDPLFM